MNVFSACLHNVGEFEIRISVGTTAITAFQRFGGMMLDAKEHDHHDTTKKYVIASE